MKQTVKIFVLTLGTCLTSCVTVPEGGYTALPNNRNFHASYDRVWGAVVSLLSEKASIKNIDKASGLITTEEFSIGSGIFSEIELKKVAHPPPSLLATYSAARASVSVFVTRHGESTNVHVTARFAGFENNLSHSWLEWPTNGVLENRILDQIGERIGGG